MPSEHGSSLGLTSEVQRNAMHYVWYWFGCIGWPTVSCVSSCALYAFHNALLKVAFPNISTFHRDPDFTCLGRQTHKDSPEKHWLPSRSSASLSRPLPGVWPVSHANTFVEPYVRAECSGGDQWWFSYPKS